MKEVEQYIGATYSDIFQTAIMSEIVATFNNPDMPTITDLGTERPKTDADMTYLKKENINEEEGCLRIRHAQDLQYHSEPKN